ncbi:hypothetical protein ACIQCJ_03340 [Streptomyces sp. NPDC093221]|uniref:hypothetical protein n=1 Tax=Streptomyces sp. NPDC093221 TaxID=3366032 RepID=UPI0038152787
MSTPEPRRRLKSLTSTPARARPAKPASASTGGDAPKVAAEGVPSALVTGPSPAREPQVIGWLHIVLPTSWRKEPRATSHCGCGRHITARGHDDVIALVTAHAEHRTLCTLHTASERRQAA